MAIMCVWVLSSKYAVEPWELFDQFAWSTGRALFLAGWTWLLYIAVEPYVRRRWPQTLISWTRLFTGRLRDPLVGRDLLIGALAGVIIHLLFQLQDLAPSLLGSQPVALQHVSPELKTLVGARHLLAQLAQPFFVWAALYYLFMLFLLRVVLRKPWLAVAAFVVAFGVLWSFAAAPESGGLTFAVIFILNATWVVLVAILLLRLGLLAAAGAFFFAFALGGVPITLDLAAWYAPGSLVTMLFLVVLAGYGCHTALAGRSLFRDDLLET
jgi:serine/threonine-protein kinase